MKSIIFITGPTASGKTSLAIRVASKCNGEIISADSRAIYKLADIATAKPTKLEQAQIKHWGIDIIEPGEYFSVSDYKKYTDNKIADIIGRGKTPIIVGGTGLYIDSVFFDYKFGPKANWGLRSELQHKTVEYLQKYCLQKNIELPENKNNKRYLIRAIETEGKKYNDNKLPIDGAIIVGISTEKDVLMNRIKQRTEQIFSDELIDETKRIALKYGWDNELMKSNAYPIIRDYLDKKLTFEQAKQKFIIADWRLAKRQLTWMRRNKYIYWGGADHLEKYITNKLAVVV